MPIHVSMYYPEVSRYRLYNNNNYNNTQLDILNYCIELSPWRIESKGSTQCPTRDTVIIALQGLFSCSFPCCILQGSAGVGSPVLQWMTPSGCNFIKYTFQSANSVKMINWLMGMLWLKLLPCFARRLEFAPWRSARSWTLHWLF